jgi:hypothetical protein
MPPEQANVTVTLLLFQPAAFGGSGYCGDLDRAHPGHCPNCAFNIAGDIGCGDQDAILARNQIHLA